MLMYAHHGAVDHLNLAVVSLYDRVHNPHGGLAPAVEAVVAGRMRPVALRQIAPRRAPVRKTRKIPLSTRRSSTRGTPRGLFGSNGSMTDHSNSVRS